MFEGIFAVHAATLAGASNPLRQTLAVLLLALGLHAVTAEFCFYFDDVSALVLVFAFPAVAFLRTGPSGSVAFAVFD